VNSNQTHRAIVESQRLWPTNVRMDLILTLGTGRSPEQEDVGASSPKKIKAGNALTRLFDWGQARLMQAISAHEMHKQVSDSLNDYDRPRYVRWDPVFTKRLPSLYDVESMDSLRKTADGSIDDGELDEVKESMAASSFYFELRKVPKYEDGSFKCEGVIKIRGDPYLILELLDSLGGLPQFVREGKTLGSCDMCRRCGHSSQLVKFAVDKLDDLETVSLRFDDKRKYRISGFPQTMSWFCEQQGLYDVFSQRPSPQSSCICDGIQKRQRSDSSRNYVRVERKPRKRMRSEAHQGPRELNLFQHRGNRMA